MDPAIAHRLVDLNRQFYQTFAAEFSATRQRVQPGVRHVLETLAPGQRILDLGCGNGELYRLLSQTAPPACYLGLDFSPGLLAAAQPAPASPDAPTTTARFLAHDLTGGDWSAVHAHAPFDLALAFAVLHHLPGQAARRRVLQHVRAALVPGRRFIHSQWQFLHSERLRQRIQPWERLGLTADQVDPGDYLLDWRRGGYGLRYVHHFDAAELAELAADTGFTVQATYFSDGATGRLSIYQVWESGI